MERRTGSAAPEERSQNMLEGSAMADQNKNRGPNDDKLARDRMTDEGGHEASPAPTGGRTSGSNTGSKSSSGAQKTDRPATDDDKDDILDDR
jgi:hypothetical protein